MSYCCEECFSNEAIKKFIQENSSIVGECEYCGSHNVSLISPRTLSIPASGILTVTKTVRL